MEDESKSKKEISTKDLKVLPKFPVDRDQFAMQDFVNKHKEKFNHS